MQSTKGSGININGSMTDVKWEVGDLGCHYLVSIRIELVFLEEFLENQFKLVSFLKE
jgi:hypothetical protein